MLSRCATTLLLSITLTHGPHAQSPARGLRLFGPYLGSDTLLVDNNGTIVHVWPSAFTPALGAYLDDDGTLVRPILTTAFAPVGTGGGVQRVALDGTVTWDYRDERPGVLPHHDIAPMPNGNVLMIAWEDKTVAEAIAAGRNPALLGSMFRPDSVVEVQPTGPTTGTIVWEWHVFDHVIQDFDPTAANFGVVANHPELVDINYPATTPPDGDWNHMNSIEYDPVNDWIVLSTPALNEIWIIDHGTTTAEAAGHTGGARGKGGDLLYRWGNPAAYRAGTPADQQLFFQHNARFVPPGRPGAGNVTVFNNRSVPTGSSVVEIVLPLDPSGQFVLDPSGRYGPAAPIWSFSAPGFGSPIMSSAERLPNGHTLVCSATQKRVFEITPGGQTVWTYTLAIPGEFPFHAHYVERDLWADAETFSLSTGNPVTFDLIAGSAAAQDTYLLLGSASGTAPGVSIQGQLLPLNPDGYFFATLGNPSTPPLAGSLGTLDNRGRATASFSIPGGLLPPALIGLRLDHAFLVLDPVTTTVTRASNASALVFAQ